MKLTHPLVVLDLETTGIWIDKDKIIEIAMIKCMPDETEQRYCQKVNPKMKIPPEVSDLTGITDDDVKNAPLFKDIAQDIITFVDSADFGGFNVERFDLPLLERELNEAGRDFKWRHRNIFDAQKVYHINEKRDLSAAYQFFCNKELKNAHSAMVDTQATLDVLKGQIEKYGEGNQDISCLNSFDYVKHVTNYDAEGKFRWWNGQLFMMFGKYARKSSLMEVVKKDPKYLEWILSANFSSEIKTLVADALKGNFPTVPK